MCSMDAEQKTVLPFLAVGRVEDGVVLAYVDTTDDEVQRDTAMDVFRRLLKAASTKMSSGQRVRLQWHEGSVCVLLNQTGVLLFAVVTAQLSYPERLAFQLLYDVALAVQQLGDEAVADSPGDGDAGGGLTEALRPRMRQLLSFYNESGEIQQMVSERAQSGGPVSSGSLVDAAPSTARGFSRTKAVLALAAVIFVALVVLVYQEMTSRSPNNATSALIAM